LTQPKPWGLPATSHEDPTNDQHDSLGKVLGYVHGDIVESACVDIPVTGVMVGDNGQIADLQTHRHIAAALTTLADYVRSRRATTNTKRLPVTEAALRQTGGRRYPVANAAGKWVVRQNGCPAGSRKTRNLSGCG